MAEVSLLSVTVQISGTTVVGYGVFRISKRLRLTREVLQFSVPDPAFLPPAQTSHLLT